MAPKLDSSFNLLFQAVDGIRYTSVTGVQTCALPSSARDVAQLRRAQHELIRVRCPFEKREIRAAVQLGVGNRARSEERRVGKERDVVRRTIQRIGKKEL